MPVSKATIGCIKKEHSKQFLDDIKKTKLNTDVLIECHKLAQELTKEQTNNKFKFTRKRYIITRNNDTEILCGMPQRFSFERIEEMGATHIKTYSTRTKAEQGLKGYSSDYNYRIIEVEEAVIEV